MVVALAVVRSLQVRRIKREGGDVSVKMAEIVIVIIRQ
jgi:hypothetical protein